MSDPYDARNHVREAAKEALAIALTMTVILGYTFGGAFMAYWLWRQIILWIVSTC